ncbi:MoxR family ATPase [Massilia sp. W12]|uniref:AAA family ATPase n=1 Tax=Massilia sp. W12 TaxID=3126507 RepID=UPI0030CFE460
MTSSQHEIFQNQLAAYADAAFDLPAMASWPATRHHFESEHILALRAAQASGRPLLLRGEPGTGKSQLAHAAAFASQRAFLPVVVDAQAQAQDLHWKFDAVARLADAQMAAILQQGADACAGNLALRHYIQPGPLWWALNWHSAQQQQEKLRHIENMAPETPDKWRREQGCVLLIDEIDKAEPDFPNGLLEVFANRAFKVPLLGDTVRQDPQQAAPLIIITTNEERELPAAFVRRCLSLTLRLPSQEAALQNWLVTRGQWHYPQQREEVLHECAQMLIQDRRAAAEYKPGLAEYLDLLRTLDQLGEAALAQLPALKRFYFDKQPDLQAGDA